MRLRTHFNVLDLRLWAVERELIIVDFESFDSFHTHEGTLFLQIFHGCCLDSVAEQDLLEHHQLSIGLQLVPVVHAFVILEDHEMHVLFFSEAESLLRLGRVVLEHVVSVQLTVQLIFVSLAVQGSFRWVKLALSHGDSGPQVVDQSCVVGHAHGPYHDVLVLNKCDLGAGVIDRGCFVTLGAFSDLADVLASEVVVDLVKLVAFVLLVEDHDNAHIFSWKNQFVLLLHLLSHEFLHVFLSNPDLRCHFRLSYIENGLVRVLPKWLQLRDTINELDSGEHFLTMDSHVDLKMCRVVTSDKSKLINTVSPLCEIKIVASISDELPS